MEATFYCTTHSTRLIYTRDDETGHVHRDIRVEGRGKNPVRCTLKEGLPLEKLRQVAQGEQVTHALVVGQVAQAMQYPVVRPVMRTGTVQFERERITETTPIEGAVAGAGE